MELRFFFLLVRLLNSVVYSGKWLSLCFEPSTLTIVRHTPFETNMADPSRHDWFLYRLRSPLDQIQVTTHVSCRPLCSDSVIWHTTLDAEAVLHTAPADGVPCKFPAAPIHTTTTIPLRAGDPTDKLTTMSLLTPTVKASLIRTLRMPEDTLIALVISGSSSLADPTQEKPVLQRTCNILTFSIPEEERLRTACYNCIRSFCWWKISQLDPAVICGSFEASSRSFSTAIPDQLYSEGIS